MSHSSSRSWSDQEVDALVGLWNRSAWASVSEFCRRVQASFPDRSVSSLRWKVRQLLDQEALKIQEDEVCIQDVLQSDRLEQQHKARLNQLQRLYDQALEQINLQERLVGAIEEAAQYIAHPEVRAPKVRTRTGSETPQTDVLMLSDSHVGDTVDAEQMRGINAYSFDVFRRRLQWLADSVFNIRQRHHAVVPLKRLEVHMLGDMLAGVLHDKPEYAEGNVAERVWVTASVLSQFLRECATIWPEVYVRGVVGNESRMTIKKKHRGRVGTSWDYMLYIAIRALLSRQENISWEIPNSFFTLAEIEGWNVLLYHGDDIKSWSGIPYYGINRAVAQFTQMLNEEDTRLDYIELAHFHQGTTLPKYRGEVFVNGSMIGTDEYAFINFRAAGTPHQWYFGMHPRNRITWRYRLELGRGGEIDQPRYVGELKSEVVEALEAAGF